MMIFETNEGYLIECTTIKFIKDNNFTEKTFTSIDITTQNEAVKKITKNYTISIEGELKWGNTPLVAETIMISNEFPLFFNFYTMTPHENNIQQTVQDKNFFGPHYTGFLVQWTSYNGESMSFNLEINISEYNNLNNITENAILFPYFYLENPNAELDEPNNYLFFESGLNNGTADAIQYVLQEEKYITYNSNSNYYDIINNKLQLNLKFNLISGKEVTEIITSFYEATSNYTYIWDFKKESTAEEDEVKVRNFNKIYPMLFENGMENFSIESEDSPFYGDSIKCYNTNIEDCKLSFKFIIDDDLIEIVIPPKRLLETPYNLYLAPYSTGGIGIGTFGSSKMGKPKFEVARNYDSYFYGDVYFKGVTHGLIDSYTAGSPQLIGTLLLNNTTYKIYRHIYLQTSLQSVRTGSKVGTYTTQSNWYNVPVGSFPSNAYLIDVQGQITYNSDSKFPINYFQSTTNFSMCYVSEVGITIHCKGRDSAAPTSYFVIITYCVPS